MLSDEDERKTPKIQDPIVPHENYDITSSYNDDIIPGSLIKLKSLFKVIREAPTSIPLAPKTDVLIYMYNVIEKIYGPEYSPCSNSRMRYDIDMHIDALLTKNKDNKRGPCYNANWDQLIPRQLYKAAREGKSIQAWITPNFPQQISRRDQDYHH